MEKNLYLIDGHAVIYKYYYAYERNPLITSYGENTSATFGLTHMLKTLLLSRDISHIGVIFDPPGGSWRKRVYPEYKAGRTKPDDISQHFARAYGLLQTWGIYTSAFENYEADDVIGAIARQAEVKGFKVWIVTRDKDYGQLVTDNICLIDLGKKIGLDEVSIIGPDQVYEKFGVHPDQILDFLALCGDTSDNVKGVEGIGPKKAVTLLGDHGSIDGIYKHYETAPDGLNKAKRGAFDKMKQKFEDSKEAVELAQRLVKLSTDIELPFDLETRLLRPPNTNPAIVKL